MREIEKAQRYLPELLNELPSRIHYTVMEAIQNEWHTKGNLSYSASEISTILQKEEGLILKELFHALNTPISQIEASSITLHSVFKDNFTQDEQTLQAITSITNSVEICKSVISAYREITKLVGISNLSNSAPLATILTMAIDIHSQNLGKNIDSQITGLESIEGYSNSYIAALLFPLIQNAIEASLDNGVVNISIYVQDHICKLSVTNQVADPTTISKEIYKPGFTTKPNHGGLGLGSVKRLLSVHKDAKLGHGMEQDFVTFQIQLPVRPEFGVREDKKVSPDLNWGLSKDPKEEIRYEFTGIICRSG